MAIRGPRAVAFINNRRSQRMFLSVPLRVSGEHANGTKFVESASTLVVNAHGGLILMKEAVLVGQKLNVKSESTNEEILCSIIHAESDPNGIHEVGIEFVRPNPKFWRVTFPPADWSPRSPEAKRLAK